MLLIAAAIQVIKIIKVINIRVLAVAQTRDPQRFIISAVIAGPVSRTVSEPRCST